MAKKSIIPVTQGRKNKVSKKHIDLTGIIKVSIVGKCPVGKSPTSEQVPNIGELDELFDGEIEKTGETGSVWSGLTGSVWSGLTGLV